VPVDSIFSRPTSVVVYGTSRPLLNWVAYAWASAVDPRFIWIDVRLPGEVLATVDPLSRNLIPPERLNVVHPHELVANSVVTNVAIGGVVRDEESADAVRRLVDFLGLPSITQEVLARAPVGGPPMVLVFSNAHRVVAAYPPKAAASVVRAVVDSGVTLLSTFADAPFEARHAFDIILHLEGSDPKEWRRATLRVEKGPSVDPLRPGSRFGLGEFEAIASVLARDLK